jgi:heat shock protein HslJ
MKHARLLVLGLVVAACAAAPMGPPLDGREFLSTSVTEGGQDRPLVEGTRVRLTFNDGQIGASAGCNTMGGSYRIEDGRLLFEGGGMTEMGCDDARHAQDDWLFGFLGARPTVSLEGNDLTLEAEGTTIELIDREVADPDRDLVGPTWTVASIISGDAVSSVPNGAVATLTFADDGRVDVQTGCNEGSGSYEVDGDRLRFGDIVTTDRACPDGAGQLEAAVLAVLAADELVFEIDAANLQITAGDIGLGLVADP